MRKKLLLVLLASIVFITCSRILDTEDNKLKLTGFIFNEVTQKPVADAQVYLYMDSGDESVLTGENGEYEFDLEFDSKTNLYITVSRDSFETQYLTQEATPGVDVEMDTVFLNPLALITTVKGVLLNSFNNEPIAGGEIYTNVLDNSVYTSSNGNFQFSFYSNEPVDVEMICKQTYFVPDTIALTTAPGYAYDLENIYLSYAYDPAEISGKVMDARADTALSNVKVSLVGYTNVYTTTDDNGNFSLGAQINITQSVSLQFSKYPFDSKVITIDQISPEEKISVGNIDLNPPAYNAVSVYGKVVGENGEPIDEVTISADQFPTFISETNENGRFSFSLQIDEAMDIEFTFEKENYITETMTVAATPENDLNLNTVILESEYENAVIQGTVLNQRTGQPVAEAKILDNETNLYVLSDAQGKFALELPIFEPTNISLTISKYPFTSKTISVDQITPEEVVDLGSVSLTPPEYSPVTISGQVVDIDTELPIEGVTVYIPKFPELTTSSDIFGNFSIVTQVDTVMTVDIYITKSDVYEDIKLTEQLEPETDLALGVIQMDSKYDPITISGQVVNYADDSPLEGVTVNILEMAEQTTKTNAAGEYTLNPVVAEDFKIHIAFNKPEFHPDTTEISVSPNTDVSMAKVPLREKITRPASIVFLGANPQEIRVKESGGNETSMLTFEVRDSSGVPIDISADTTVYVEIISQPPKNTPDDILASIYPNECRTSSNGQIKTSITSGTVAGPVEVRVYLYTDKGDLVKSEPTSLVIHAGHPDVVHFSVAPDVKNIAGLVYQGLTDEITATVGDKYGNWVDDGTPVYFTASGGIIGGFAATTDAQATVTLLTGPNQPLTTNGFVTLTARTNDVNNNMIETNNLVLFSGHSNISDFTVVSESDTPEPGYLATLDQGGSATLNFKVADVEFGNPLTAGTELKVTATPDTLASVNSTFPDDGLSDVMYGNTDYSLTVIDNPSSISGGAVNIKLKLTSVNGNITRMITVYVRPLPTP